MRKKFGLGFAPLLILALTSPALADTSRAIFAYTNSLVPADTQLILTTPSGGQLVVNASQNGWYDQNGNPNGVGDLNYIAGICGSSDSCLGDDLNRHDYFVFSVPAGTYVSATLSLLNPPNAANPQDGYISTNPTETYTSWDVTTPFGELGSMAGVGIFNDLGSGVQYASTIVSAADDGTFVNINLDAAALSAINGDAGSQFALGGAVTLTSTPEPCSLLLLGSGLAGLLTYLRRRKS